MKLPDISINAEVRGIVGRALVEDIGARDITTEALVPASERARAVVVAHGACVVSGTTVAKAVFRRVDPSLEVGIPTKDGRCVLKGGKVLTVAGRAGSILSAERTALNFLQRMSGIATLTSMFVAKVRRFGVTILDTRKTTPGLRVLEKYAVLCGGGKNHRMGLYDMVLIKDNHRRVWVKGDGRTLAAAVVAARKRFPGATIEIEVENLSELSSALEGSPDWILLDNMTPGRVRECVKQCRGRTRLEASGGITLKNVERIARAGVDAISLGCITHSAPAANLSLEFME